MAVRYGSKKYYKEKYEDKCTEYRKSLDTNIALREAFEFVFNHTDKNPHRVEVSCYGGSMGTYGTTFTYVDKEGTLHRLHRQTSTEKIRVLSADADGALICYQATKPYTYYHLDKVKETFTEIPARYMCDIAVTKN